MNKFFTFLLLLSGLGVTAQTELSRLFSTPPSGLMQLRNENAYLRLQQKNANSWVDDMLFLAQKAPNTDSIGINTIYGWQSDNTWKESQTSKDSFVLDNQGRVSIHISDDEYFFSSGTYRIKSKYAYTYASTNKPVKARLQYAQAPSYTSYYNAAEVLFFYDQDGHRVHDSTYLYENGNRINTYFEYDTQGRFTFQFSLMAGDTIAKAYLTYNNGPLPATVFTTQLDLTTDEWDTTGADTMTYDAQNHLTRHIHWGLLITSGNPDTHLGLISDESYHYTPAGKLDEIIEVLVFQGNGKEKTSIEYDNANKPVVGYKYQESGGGWSTEAFSRYLFEVPTGLTPVTAPAISVNVYPNPCKEVLAIAVENAVGAIKQIALYDINGKCVYTSNLGERTIDVTGFKNGIYLLHIATEEGIANQRVMVQH